ncbi:hypothetical protein D9753_08395 [Streptomyces dangxiongensis]|uniref:Uncharacterized protein n=1 Tax=Streptomyces dangxiongensis TaxID=1442032 RepID=A0A3G2J9G0_9ACTN|nr:hypothetical protein [Streptomyces dangxiongensis]AYN38933.1 hypothetical protein D9753_08395 [Streptomyces dangxiongensis]
MTRSTTPGRTVSGARSTGGRTFRGEPSTAGTGRGLIPDTSGSGHPHDEEPWAGPRVRKTE